MHAQSYNSLNTNFQYILCLVSLCKTTSLYSLIDEGYHVSKTAFHTCLNHIIGLIGSLLVFVNPQFTHNTWHYIKQIIVWIL